MLSRLLNTVWILVTCSGSVYPQGVITTIAGTDFLFNGDGKPALQAPLGGVTGVATDGSGNVYIADPGNSIVVRVSPEGVLTIVAGNGIAGYSGDGASARNASLNNPVDVKLDSNGDLYIADTGNGRIRRVSRDGTISTIFAGSSSPQAIAVDQSNNIYVAEYAYIRAIAPNGTTTILAGNGSEYNYPLTNYISDGGSATSGSVGCPFGVAVNAAGTVYFSDPCSGQVRKISFGVLSTVAGNVNAPNFTYQDGVLATKTWLATPYGIVFDELGTLYIAAGGSCAVYKVTPDGIIHTLAGGMRGFSGDGGRATAAQLNTPFGLATDSNGGILIADSGNQRVRIVNHHQVINTIAGNGRFRYSVDGIPAVAATFNGPYGIALDAETNVYIADPYDYRIRRIRPDGLIDTIAGTGEIGLSTAGIANQVHIQSSQAVAADGQGNVYFSSISSPGIWKVTPTGFLSTLPLTSIFEPVSLVVGPDQNLYAGGRLDSPINQVVQVTPSGQVTVVAGGKAYTPGAGGGSLGDGGPATSASLGVARELATDTHGDLFIADTFNARVRMVNPSGIIATVAGNGKSDFSGDGGLATEASLIPLGVAADNAGSFYVATLDNRVRKVTPDGIIRTIVGNGDAGFSGDGGPAVNAMLNGPEGLAVDAERNLYIADWGNNRIREVLAQPPSLNVSTQSLGFTGSSGGAPAATRQFSVFGSIPGIQFTTAVSSSASWLTVTPSGATPRLVEVTADPGSLSAGSYNATITVQCPYASPTTQTVSVTFIVGAAVPPSLQVDQDHLSFTYPRSANARSQTLVITNAGGGSLQFKASASTNNGGSWLQVSTSQGSVTPRAPLTLNVQADPTGLQTGTYSGSVTIAANAGQHLTIPVIMSISTAQTAILLSQTGLSFTAVAGGGVVPPQSFGILNIGSGSVSWTVSTSTLAGGQGWLTTSQTQGSTDAASSTVPTVAVQINPEGLAPGEYYGLIRVDAPGAANTPQVLTASLEVLAPGANPGSVVQPNELVFNTASGANPPGSQELFIYDLAQAPVSYRSGVDASIQYAPVDGTVVPQQPTRVVVQPATSALGVGTYKQDLTLQFSDGTVRDVRITTIVGGGGSSGTTATSDGREVGTAAAGSKHGARTLDTAGTCTPTKLLPAFISLGQYSNVPAGWPSGLVVQVQDDCGNAMTTGNVTVSFSTGDLPIVLQSLKDGSWHGTWQSSAPAAQITLTAAARQLNLQGSEQIEANLSAVHNPPVIRAGGVVNSASSSAYVPVSPGALITIYGDNLAESTAAGPMAPAPLPKTLGGAQVLMAGEILPLVYADEKRINAVVPYDIAASTNQQILVRRALTYSRPVAVDVAEAQPEIFTSAKGMQVEAEVVRTIAGKQQKFLVSADHPATGGDKLEIKCMGLGPVTPTQIAGTAGPRNPEAATTEPVQVQIGGVAAKLLFAGLSPGQIGLYEVDAIVPPGVSKGPAVPIVMEVGGLKSQVATIPIQ